MRRLFLAAALVWASPLPAAPVDRLRVEVARLAGTTDGVVGVAAQRLDGGPALLLNAERRFPMASTVKIAVAARVLALVDAGALTLDRLVPVAEAQRNASDGIAELLPHPGIALSVHNLLELSLTVSDNTATDTLMRLAGGPAAVTAWVRAQGIADLRVDGDIAALLEREGGFPDTGAGLGAARAAARAANPALAARMDADRTAPGFDADPRDTATPAAMLALLARIGGGRALSPASTAVLTGIMGRARSGARRLKGLLPEGVAVAHKTGTLAGIANDVGLVTLPDEGILAIAVFTAEGVAPGAVRERAIAEIARTAYDFFVLNPPDQPSGRPAVSR